MRVQHNLGSTLQIPALLLMKLPIAEGSAVEDTVGTVGGLA